MNCEPVYVRILWFLLTWCVSMIILGSLYLRDKDMRIYTWKYWCKMGSGCWLLCVLFLCAKAMNSEPVVAICYGLLNIYFCTSMAMDISLKMICDILHFPAIMAGGILLWYYPPAMNIIGELIVFVLLQYAVFAKMYGGADVVAFCLCALFLAGLGSGVEAYVCHMAITFGMLGIVQWLRGNISGNGNLKRPVALLPYISVAFFMII